VNRLPYVAGVVVAVLSGCSLAPKYRPPPPPAEVATYEEAGDWMPAAPADATPRGAWWEAFGEPTLNELERELTESNPDLRAAVARFEQARGLAIQTRSNIFPSVGADVQATRGKSSTYAPLTRALDATPSTSNDFLAGLNLNWDAQAQASAADLAAVQLSLQAELATDFFSLRGDDTTIQLLEDTIKVYDRAFELTRNRYKEGISAATDVDQADTLRQNARSQLAAVRLERAQLEHAIAVLLGKVPAAFKLDPGELAGSPPPLDAGLPSKLLERRPDVSRAERNMFAANAQVGVARAAWFPVFSIAGTGGFESINSSSWFKAPSHFWSVGPAAALPLLDGGARYGLTKQARAQYDEAMETYRKTTLTAYQEVEDSLAGLHHLADQRRADEAAAASAQSSAYHADQRYDAGVADYVEVTTTHTAALNAQRDTISVRVAQMNASVALVRATGGGWTQDQIDHPAMP
jgi:outer membrane protein, multidrug efflux system